MRKAPRYVLQIVLTGGVDPIFLTDPKERGDLDADIDLPYARDAILAAGPSRFGPHFAPLSRWAARMTVVNGVWVGVANHPAGVRQALRLRQGATDEMPTALEVLGSHRDGQALGCVSMTSRIMFASAPSTIGSQVWRALDGLPPEDLMVMARSTRARGDGVLAGTDLATKANIEDSATFLERLATTPRFAPPPQKGDRKAFLFGSDLLRASWLFEHDLARCAVVGVGNWDTHVMNAPGQTGTSGQLLPKIADLLGHMEATSSKHGSLLDNTLIVISSELGRYPVLNARNGKDHFPEMPMIFVNAEGGGRVFGRTGRRMQALPFAERKSGQVSLTDVGATVLRLAGVNPETAGYRGELLEFLGV